MKAATASILDASVVVVAPWGDRFTAVTVAPDKPQRAHAGRVRTAYGVVELGSRRGCAASSSPVAPTECARAFTDSASLRPVCSGGTRWYGGVDAVLGGAIERDLARTA